MAANLLRSGFEKEIFTLHPKFQLIDILIQIFRPTHLFFFILDGSSPLQKGFKKGGKDFGKSKKKFTKHSIYIPGIHQRKKSNKVFQLIEEKVENDSTWAWPHILFSTAHSPGEGESKIFKMIPNYPNWVKHPILLLIHPTWCKPSPRPIQTVCDLRWHTISNRLSSSSLRRIN
jgi:5'-3' exonuclease